MNRKKVVVPGIIFAALSMTGIAVRCSGCGGEVRDDRAPITMRGAQANATLLATLGPAADDLMKRAAETSKRIAAPRTSDYLTPSEAEDLRQLAFAYLQQTKILAQIMDETPSGDDRSKTLQIAARLAAGLTQQDLSRAFVLAFENVKLARDQLDRPLVRDHIPPRLYRRIREAQRSLSARAALRETIDHFQAAEVQRLILDEPETGEMRRLARRIYASPSYDELRRDEEIGRIVARGGEKTVEGTIEAAAAAQEAFYPAQVFISEIIGDAVTSTRGPKIAPERAEKTREVARPGDVILERCDFYLSNSFLPGWWGHAALYVGDRKQVEALGLAGDPAVARHLEKLGSDHDLLEAVSDGVVISSLHHIMRADHIAVLRPRYKDEEARKNAIRRAFAHVGKAYDFNFDFQSDDVLVCSELCWRALEGVLDAKLTKRFGRYTLTPDDLAHLAIGEKPQLELVEFIKDGKDAGRVEYEAVLR